MGIWTSGSLHKDEARNFQCSSVGILQPQEANHVADRCKNIRSWCLFLTGEKPVYFASKTITETQKGYVAIEIESLELAWAMEKIPPLFICQSFHLRNWPETAWSYIIEEFQPSNSKNTVDTDEDFCLPLYSKIHSWWYKPACTLFVMARWSKDTIKVPKLHIYKVTSQLNAKSGSLQDIRIATQEDDELALLKHTITSGWPSTMREVPSDIQSYWTFREELTVEDGIVLKGTIIINLHKKYQATLNLIHEGHLGLTKCKPRILFIG